MKKKVTIYDVAMEADVSLATVSRVINKSPSVKANTRKRVQDAIDRLNFVPSAVAQGLALNKTTNIALIVPETSYSYISKIINGVIDVCHIYNYNVILHTTNYGRFEVNKIVENVLKTRMDGVIILNSEVTQGAIDELNRYQIPIAVIGQKVESENVSSVYVDYEKALYEVAKSYLDKNESDISFIDGEYNRNHVDDMLHGIKRAFEEKGLEFTNIISTDDSYTSSYETIYESFKVKAPKVVIGARDSLAIAALNAAYDLGLTAPEDIEVVGVNDTKYARMARPALSSVHIPLYDLGAIAARQLTKLLENKSVKEEQVYELPVKLITRKTTK